MADLQWDGLRSLKNFFWLIDMENYFVKSMLIEIPSASLQVDYKQRKLVVVASQTKLHLELKHY